MNRGDLLWFEDVSAINEPVLSFPVLGRISMKQFFILGLAGMISYGIFSATHGPDSAIPVCIGALVALVRPKVCTAEYMALSALSFIFRQAGLGSLSGLGSKKSVKTARPCKERCKAKPGPKVGTLTITLSDVPEPLLFRIKVMREGGSQAVQKKLGFLGRKK